MVTLLRQVLQIDKAGHPALFIQDAAVQAADEDAPVGGDGDILPGIALPMDETGAAPAGKLLHRLGGQQIGGARLARPPQY